MWDKTTLAYLAGIIDGEGCIYIDRFLQQQYKKGKRYQYVLRIQIGNTYKPLILWLKKTFGGYFNTSKWNNKRWKTFYTWRIGGYSKAIYLLKIIKPFLIIKYKQAELAIEFEDTCYKKRKRKKNGRFLPVLLKNLKIKERLYKKIGKLNSRGQK